MKRILFILSFFAILASSCSDDAILDRKERRLTGTWKIERATYKEDWAIFNDNVIGFYEGDHITFFEDYTANYDDNSLQTNFEGDWGLVLERGDDEKFIYVDMLFYDHVNDEDFSYFAEITFLTHRKLKMTVVTDDGRYRFKLTKI